MASAYIEHLLITLSRFETVINGLDGIYSLKEHTTAHYNFFNEYVFRRSLLRQMFRCCDWL